MDKCHVYKHVHALSQFMRDMIFYNLFAPKCWICLTYRRSNSLDRNQFHQKSCDFFLIYVYLFQFWDVFADFPYFKVTTLLKIIWTKSTCFYNLGAGLFRKILSRDLIYVISFHTSNYQVLIYWFETKYNWLIVFNLFL